MTKELTLDAIVHVSWGARGSSGNISGLLTGPVVTPGQEFAYEEGQLAGAALGTVLATDDVGVIEFRFAATGTALSSDGYFRINAAGIITMTGEGAASPVNEYQP